MISDKWKDVHLPLSLGKSVGEGSISLGTTPQGMQSSTEAGVRLPAQIGQYSNYEAQLSKLINAIFVFFLPFIFLLQGCRQKEATS